MTPRDEHKPGLIIEDEPKVAATPAAKAPATPKKRLRQRKTYTLSDRTVEHISELGAALRDSDSRIVDRAIEDYFKRMNGLTDEDYMNRYK